jgi:hypothetical protein
MQKEIWDELQNRNRFRITNSGRHWIWNLVGILKCFRPFMKNPRNSPKFYLLKIFNSVNLAGLTCIQSFEVPLQVAIRT